jgi:hypothetical protein
MQRRAQHRCSPRQLAVASLAFAIPDFFGGFVHDYYLKLTPLVLTVIGFNTLSAIT